MKTTFSPETKQSIAESQNNYCKLCLNPIHSYHHKLQNTVANRKKFPLFLHSPMNGVGLCENAHKNKAHKFKITTQEAEVYENWLRNLICDMPFSGVSVTYEKIERG